MLNWHTIDTVLLDMDGTLLDLHYDNHFWTEFLPQRYTDKHGGALKDNRERLLNDIMAKKGSLEWYCLDYWSETLNLDIIGLKTEMKEKISLRPWVIEFLQALHEAKKTVWLATNSHRDGLELKMAETGLGQYFHQQIVSHDYRAPKESPEFWHALQQQHHFDPARSLFIDDSIPVLEAAASWGIEHLVCIQQPDSRQTRNDRIDFPSIQHFDELLPLKTP